MDVDRFAEFAELSKRLNFTEASKVLHVSQPTLSKHIKSLEDELRAPLFDRSGTEVDLTQIGVAILPAVFRLIEARAEIDQIIKAARSKMNTRLSVGGLLEEPEIIALLSSIVSTLGPTYGYDFLVMRNTRLKDMPNLLENRSFDVIFDYIDEDDDIQDGLGLFSVMKVPYVVICNRNHRLAQKDCIHFSDLANETFVKLEGHHIADAWRFVERSCKEAGFTPKTEQVYFMEIVDMLRITASMGNSILVFSHIAAQRMQFSISPQCVTIPVCDTNYFMPISAIYRVADENPLLDDFIKALKTGVGKQA